MRRSPVQVRVCLSFEVLLAKGNTAGQACKAIGVTEQMYYRRRREYGRQKVEQARRLKLLDKENARLRRAVANLTLDKLIPADAVNGNF